MKLFRLLFTLLPALEAVAQIAPKAIFFPAGPAADSNESNGFIGTNLTRWANYKSNGIQFDSGLHVAFAGANAQTRLEGHRPGVTRVHRFTGNSRSGGLSTGSYDEVIYRDLYPGVDLHCRMSPIGWKNDFVLKQGADIKSIRMRYSGGKGPVSLGEEQQLKIRTTVGEMEERIPEIYQVMPDGTRITKQGGYVLLADGSVGFTASALDPTLETVIDPELYYSSYWSGSRFDSISAVVLAPDDTVFVAGWTESTNLPVLGAYQGTNRGSTDGFVAKLAAGGQTLLWATFLGGTGSERINAMALDAQLRPVVAGWTSSTNFPISSPIQSTMRGSTDSFVTRLSATGATLDFSTYFGGLGADSANSIAVDSTGIYFVGQTSSSDFPTTGFYTTPRGGLDGFLTKLSSTGTATIYSTYIGGSSDDLLMGVAVNNGEAFIAGGTSSTNLFVINGSGPRGGMDAFAMKIAASGTGLSYCTYIGGTSTAQGFQELATSIAVNSSGEAYIAGVTNSSNFPLVNAAQTAFGGGGSDGFVVKLNATGSASLWSTYVGGSSYEIVNAIALRGTGQLAITGMTGSFNFPAVNPIQTNHGGAYDAFIGVYSATGTLTFSSLWGGAGSDAGSSITAGTLSGNTLLIAGSTSSSNLNILSGYQSSSNDFVSQNGFWANIIVPGGNALKKDKAGYYRSGGWAMDKTGDFIWNTGDTAFPIGVGGDIPVVGDWDGTGKKRIGLFRGGVWYLDTTGDNNWTFGIDRYFYFGIPNDKPIIGDWNKIGKDCLGTYRNGIWYLDWDGSGGWNTGIDKGYAWGTSADRPLVGDWTGTGYARGGLYNAGNWKLDISGDWAFTAGVDSEFSFGTATDFPIAANFTGGPIVQVYLWRPSTGAWFHPLGSFGNFGLPGDYPVVGPWLQ